MIKYLVHTADWHIKPYKDHNKSIHATDLFLKSVDEQFGHIPKEQIRIVITGDIFDNKSKEPSNEAFDVMSKILMKISKKYHTIITIGNHDYDINNPSRLDCITPIINLMKILDYKNITFKKHTECFVDGNIVFCNYSNYDNNSRPNIEQFRKKYPEKSFVGLFHDIVDGSINFLNDDVSSRTSHSTPVEVFDGCDFVLMGDIHKHQRIPYKVPVVYCGSLYQVNVGETVGGHGYCIWDVENKSYDFVEVDLEYGHYKMEITSIEDIENNQENFINL